MPRPRWGCRKARWRPQGGLILLVVALGWAVPNRAPGAEPAGEWVPLFDGRTLEGWRSNESEASFRVVEGAIVCVGPRSHLFYAGPVQGAQFVDFEFAAEVRTRAGANSGIYFHTEHQASGWLDKGYEVQVNNTATGEGGYRENKKTGSLYGVRNVHRQLVADETWFTLRIAVRGRRITVHVNEVKTVDYREPEEPPRTDYPGRRLSRGTFALQCHDPGSWVAYRNLRVRPLAPQIDASSDATAYEIPADLSRLHANNYPVIDLHTHLKGGLTIDEVVARHLRTGINAGVAVNGGIGFAVTNDAGLERALPALRHPLVFVGLQAEGREWVRLFSREALARFDYVFTDAMTVVNDRGRRMRLWIPDETEVGDPQEFMEMLVARTVAILESEPIDFWANPTFLPAPLAADYDRLWTPERMDRVIAAAVRKGVAIEINDRFRLPSVAFVRRAKEAGARFTLGTNNGGRDDLGRLAYGAEVARVCGLRWQDFWMPGIAPSRAASHGAGRPAD